MRALLVVTLFIGIGLRDAHGQEFVQHYVPNDSISSSGPLVRPLPNGGLWMAWYTYDTRINPWVTRMHARKLDAVGQILATTDLRFPLVAPLPSLEGAAVLPDGGLALTGNFEWHGMYIRLNADGSLAAAKQYDFGFIERLWDVAVLADGSPVMVGRYDDTIEERGLVMRTDVDGVVLAASGQSFLGGAALHWKVRTTADGGLLAMGQQLAGIAYTDLHVMKFDSLAQVSWGRHFTGAQLWPVEAVQHADGGWTVLATQQVQDTIVSGAPVLISLAADGTVGANTRVWAAPVGSTFQMATSLSERENGGLIVCALVNALAGTAMFAVDSIGTVAASARVVPDSTLGMRVNARSLAGGQLLLHAERFNNAVQEWSPLVALWDTTNAFPCGSAMVPVVTDNIILGLDTALEHTVPNPAVLDIMAQLVPDTIGWSVEHPCDLGTAVPEGAHEVGSLHAYPVPARDRLWLEGLDSAEELLLLNARGELMARWTTPVPQPLQLPVLEDGLFLLRARARGQFLSTRVVVQH